MPWPTGSGRSEVTLVSSTELKDTGKDDGRSTRHIEVALAEGMEYRPGDHLCVVPVNDNAVVERLLTRFGLDRDSYVRIESRSDMRGPFPSGSTFSVLNLAQTAGELQAVATRKDIAALARHAECPDTRGKLEALAKPAGEGGADLYTSEILAKRKSVLDVLEEFPACDLPLAVFLELIPFISPRYYSISSAPGANPGPLLDHGRRSRAVRPFPDGASSREPVPTISRNWSRATHSRLSCVNRQPISACRTIPPCRSSWSAPVPV